VRVSPIASWQHQLLSPVCHLVDDQVDCRPNLVDDPIFMAGQVNVCGFSFLSFSSVGEWDISGQALAAYRFESS
jgi:hypothetical protein